MQSLNSDQLRKLLKKHTRKMSWLAEQNDLIVAALKQRGLQAVDPAGDDISIHPCIMQLDKLQSEPKPLTADELKAGGWRCGDTSEACRLALESLGFKFFAQIWDNEFDSCGVDDCAAGTIRRWFKIPAASVLKLKQIHRVGNNFYWGAASDKAN